jgi:hypothetical protein
MKRTNPPHQQAVVLGDSLPGLLAAQALAGFFRRVVVVAQPEPSSGPPVLLHGRDQEALEELFPGLIAELVAAGAVSLNLGLHVAWLVSGRWRPRYRSNLVSLACSRLLLEEAICGRLAGCSSISFILDGDVLGLELGIPAGRAYGVRLGAAGTLTAALVVDASGKVERALGWLQAAGLSGPPPRLAASPLVAAGRLYQRPATAGESWRMLVVQPTGDQPRRGALLLPLEGDRLYLALFGASKDAPPLVEEGFLAFARTLPTPLVFELMQRATPLSPIEAVPLSSCSLHAQPPAPVERFILLPQPDCSPNPVLPQTVSQALSSRTALHAALVASLATPERLEGINGRWQQQIAESLRPACLLARTETQRWAGVVEMGGGPMSRYMEQLLAASLHSAEVVEALYRVQQMVEPPALLFRPDIVLQVVGQ